MSIKSKSATGPLLLHQQERQPNSSMEIQTELFEEPRIQHGIEVGLRAQPDDFNSLSVDDLAAVLVREENQDAWGELYNRLMPFLVDYATKVTRDMDSAKDLAQDTMMRAWEKRESFDPGRSYRKWINTILIKEGISRARGSQNRSVLLAKQHPDERLGSTKNDTETEVERSELKERLRRILDQLTQSDRDLLGAWSEGTTLCEYADERSLNRTTVRSRFHRAREKLKEAYSA